MIINGTPGNDRLTGTNNDDIINGFAGSDRLNGLTGNDSLFGGDGNDTIFGGTGNDTMTGGAGNDTYVVDSVGDVVNEDDGLGASSGGIDTVQASISYTLGNYIENLTLTGTGALYFDLDGSGAGFSKVQLALFNGGVTLSESNITVVA